MCQSNVVTPLRPSRVIARSLVVLSCILAFGWSAFSFGSDTSQFSQSGEESAVAIATANKSARIESGHSPLRRVSYVALVQNEAGAGTQPQAGTSNQSTQKPKPDAASANPAQVPPATTQPSNTPATLAPATIPSSPVPPEPLTPFSSLELLPGQRPFLSRLSRSPDLFGDSFIPNTADIDVGGDTGNTALMGSAQTDLPMGGGMRRFKNEQSRALPTDRVFFLYNHFHNALELRSDNVTDSKHVDQFTFGFEKTFGDGQWSFELRMPFSGEADLSAGGAAVQADGVGNLVATLKHLLYSDSTFAAALGLAVVAPTGSDASVLFQNSNVRLEFENKATHLLPYAAVQITPDDHWFFHALCQIDVGANQNQVFLDGGNFTATGSIADQTLMYLDASAGYWWYQSTDDDGLTGLASVLELHYTTTLNDADVVNLRGANIGNLENRFDVVNMTAGIHSEWNRNTSIRVAVVVPLNRNERLFDSEGQIAVIRRY